MINVAAIQMVSGQDIDLNLEQARELIVRAADEGCRLVVLPENFALFQTSAMLEAGREEAEAGRVRGFLQGLSREHGIWIVGGSTPCARRPDGTMISGRVRSTCWVTNDQGDVAGRYDKIHLFDVDVQDAHGQYQESQIFEPGDEVVTVDTPFGRLGLAVCYDLRFPELFRRFQEQNVDLIALPAAFTQVTGEAHWHVLLRARAVENQCFMIAAGQGGRHSERRETYGHSMVIDAWGKILAEQDKGPAVVCATLDQEHLDEIRRRMPVKQHRRLTF